MISERGMKMKFQIIVALIVSIVCAQDPTNEVVEPNNDPMESPGKEAVVQHPVTVSMHAPQPMSTKPPNAPLKTRVVVVHNNMVPVPIECFQPPDSGTCSKDMARIYYDHETRTCKPFSYTGCGGNANRFQSIKNCYRICHPYRYKIRPKVAAKKTSAEMKVRMLPPKQQSQGDMMSSSQGQGGPQARSMPQQTQQYSNFGPQQQYQNYGPQPQQRPQYGPQQPYGQQVSPLTQRHVVMTPNGPQVKNQQMGSGSGVPGNTGTMSH